MKSSRSHRLATRVVPLSRGLDTRDRVLQVSLSLFADRGYRGTSLRDIAKRIGIKAPSLLHHFPSKQQLYLAVLDHIFNAMEDSARLVMASPGGPQEQMRKAEDTKAALDEIQKAMEQGQRNGLLPPELLEKLKKVQDLLGAAADLLPALG